MRLIYSMISTKLEEIQSMVYQQNQLREFFPLARTVTGTERKQVHKFPKLEL